MHCSEVEVHQLAEKTMAADLTRKEYAIPTKIHKTLTDVVVTDDHPLTQHLRKRLRKVDPPCWSIFLADPYHLWDYSDPANDYGRTLGKTFVTSEKVHGPVSTYPYLLV